MRDRECRIPGSPVRTRPCYYPSNAFALAPEDAPVRRASRPTAMSTPGHSLRWFARPLVLAVGALLTLFALTGVLALRYWHERQAANLSLEHSRQVLDKLDRLRTIIADLEAERRGYLLTFDPAYLKAYGVSDESVRRETQTLHALVANDPLQSLRAGHLALIVSAKLREIDDMLKTARASGLAALAMIRGMNEIHSQIDQMVDHERFLLVDRERRAEALEQRKTWLIAAAVVIVALFAGTALALARREAKRRRKATEENVQLYSDLEARDKKIRRLFDSNIIGIIIWDVEGRIFEANDAFLRIVGYDREDLASGHLNRTDLTPPEWRDRDARTVAELTLVGSVPPFEKEYFRKDGSRVPVLIGGAMFEEGRNHGGGFVLDLTELKQAEAEARESERRYRETLMELAHANRVATMGQLSASITHEVKQPITAAVTYAVAARRWLSRRPPELEEARESPVIEGDRVQLQQVILNLIMNAVESMSSVNNGTRELFISSQKAEPGGVLVRVRDSGPGLAPATLERLFNAFYTTKPGGLGLGLSICRSIIETHGGRLSATANEPRGATLEFIVPVCADIRS